MLCKDLIHAEGSGKLPAEAVEIGVAVVDSSLVKAARRPLMSCHTVQQGYKAAGFC